MCLRTAQTRSKQTQSSRSEVPGSTGLRHVILIPYLGQLQNLRQALTTDNDPILSDLNSYELVRAGLINSADAGHTEGNQVEVRPPKKLHCVDLADLIDIL